jgi:hypothetical protein
MTKSRIILASSLFLASLFVFPMIAKAQGPFSYSMDSRVLGRTAKIRVTDEKLDSFITLSKELVLIEARLDEILQLQRETEINVRAIWPASMPDQDLSPSTQKANRDTQISKYVATILADEMKELKDKSSRKAVIMGKCPEFQVLVDRKDGKRERLYLSLASDIDREEKRDLSGKAVKEYYDIEYANLPRPSPMY